MFLSPKRLNEMIQLGDDFQGVIVIDAFININLTYVLIK